MKVAFGLKAHSGWAALVVLGVRGSDLQVVDRRRLEMVESKDEWAKQPYHAAEALSLVEARKLVKYGVESARRLALREMRTSIKRVRADGHEISGCGLLVGATMPDWSVDEILAVHFRMHKAEGFLFRDVLARAAKKCELRLVEVPEKFLTERAEAVLATPLKNLLTKIAALGKSVGPPWGKDQKDATLAAMIALRARSQ
jgi:hypothetical protein